MKQVIVGAGCLIAGLASIAIAQTDDGHSQSMAGPSSPWVDHFAITFSHSPPACPERRGAFEISGKAIWLIGSESRGNPSTGGVSRPADDETYLYRLMTYDCVINIAIRAQVYGNGLWTPLLVPRGLRPSLPPKERMSSETRRKLDELSKVRSEGPKRVAPSAQSATGERSKWLEGPGSLPRSIRLFQQTGHFATYFEFEGMPDACVNAAGQFRIDQTGIALRFPVAITDDVNRFSAELRRFDDFQGQVKFIRDKCRVEMTLNKAMRNDDHWLPIPLAAVSRVRSFEP